jgi:hypothetical protein
MVGQIHDNFTPLTVKNVIFFALSAGHSGAVHGV